MKCCIKCFRDSEIKAIIEALKVKGDCDFCGKKSVYIYDIDTNSTITEFFEGLLDVYTPASSLPETFPKENLDLLKNILYRKWNVFAVGPEDIYRLLTNICREKYIDQPNLFDEPLGILELTQPDYLGKNSILRTFQWNEFVEEIKCKNRFHTNYINKKILGLFLQLIKKTYKVGQIFYRGRISPHESGFDASRMGAPPNNKASAGRANPEGISCLYLADSEDTTLHEVRAGVYDYVTIGTFELVKDIEIVNLAELDKISPFLVPDCSQLAINLDHLKKISKEISKPLRRSDSYLDYLPTQYISDYIKSQNFNGIEYKSTMKLDGFNLAIFDVDCFRCIDTKVYDVKSLNYAYNQID